MRRLCSLLLLLSLLFLSACRGDVPSHQSANLVIAIVKENTELFTRCVEEMESFHLERIYVALEQEETEEWQTVTGETRLVSFEKESDDRTEIENEILEEALSTFGFEVIFFQTASDSRRNVIFSFTRESDDGVQNGFYYSYDALPSGWWGRRAQLERKDNRYLQANKNGDAWYYTVQIQDHFYYFEKMGDLLA